MLTPKGKKKLSLLLVLVFALTMVVPGMAVAAAVTNVTVTPTSYAGGALSTNYTVTFNTYSNTTTADFVYMGLYYSGGAVAPLFPAGTGTIAGNVYFNGAPVTVVASTYNASLAKIPVLANVGAGGSVTIQVYGLTNPAAGVYYMGVYTTADTTVASSAYLSLSGGDSGPAPPPAGGGGSSGTTTTPGTTAPAEQAVSATVATTVATADGSVAVTLPAGAVTGSGTVKVTEVAAASIPSVNSTYITIGSKVFEITLTGAELTGNVVLSFNFDTAKFANIPAEQIGVYYYNETRGSWVYAGGDVDTASGKASCEVNHFTKFAVMANTKLPILSDVASHWAVKDIKRLIGMQAVGGYEDKTFKPDNNITRNEFAVILAQAMAWKANSEGAAKFKDQKDIPDWAKGYVGAAVEKGVISGYEDGTFGGDRLVTRSEIAAMVVKALGKSASTENLTFKDAADAPAWAAGVIATAVKEGIVKGSPDNTFAPNANATRAESATMIVRVLNNLKI